jgi:hypothetical protein
MKINLIKITIVRPISLLILKCFTVKKAKARITLKILIWKNQKINYQMKINLLFYKLGQEERKETLFK